VPARRARIREPDLPAAGEGTAHRFLRRTPGRSAGRPSASVPISRSGCRAEML
jgi:hypothetical protein